MSISRRTFLAAAGALALEPQAAFADGAPSVKLRLMATSDLHMFVMDWDYYHAKVDPSVGLVKIASLVAAARRENPNSFLFDNGDLLQGDPLADYLAMPEHLPPGALHPVYELMNGMRYDAAGLGNHEFNYGLAFLERALNGPAFPYVCANILRTDGRSFVPPSCVVTRDCLDSTGATRTLRVGVIGFAPPQIVNWDKSKVEGKIIVIDAVEAARQHLPTLREKCDIVVALLHGGIDSGRRVAKQENPALALAELPGIDALVLGHQHQVLPGPHFAGANGVDAEAGKIGAVPAVMPGFWGSHLGVIDLDLTEDAGKWRVAASRVEARPIVRRDAEKLVALADDDATAVKAIASAHRATLDWMEQPVGRLASSLDSFFVWAGYDPATALVNEAQLDYGRHWLAATPHADLPLLSAMSPCKAGYTPNAFVDIPAGPMALRDVADLYIYANTITALRLNGAQILDWLEYSARAFLQIHAGEALPQELVDRHVPSYNFDTLAGLTYAIDPTRPTAFRRDGSRIEGGGRISDLRYNGELVAPGREFIVMTNSYRADSGKTPGVSGAAAILRAPDGNRDAVVNYVRAKQLLAAPPAAPWRFVPPPRKIRVQFDTALAARDRINEVPGMAVVGDGAPGFLRVAFDLG